MSCDRSRYALRTVFVLVCGMSISDASLCQPGPETAKQVPKERANTFSLYGGMGISLAAATATVDYLNTLVDASQRVDEFATAVEFFGGAEFPVTDEWGGAVEYSYLFKSYTLPTTSAGTYTLFYNVNMPTAMAHFVIPGRGYFLKLGGGAGYHFGSITQTSSLYGTDSSYTARGFGVKLQAVGQTAFDERLFAYIGGDMRWEFLGKAKSANGEELRNRGEAASLSMFAVGLRFGLIYYF